jgi:hypothetical protein
MQTSQPSLGGPSSSTRPPSIWQDPSEHILSGKGSTLQHARSVYAAGPVEVLPGLYLGDEHNACDAETLSDLGITTILNVAKETELPFQREERNSPLTTLAASRRSAARLAPPVTRETRSPSTPSIYHTPMTSMFMPGTPALAQPGAGPSSGASGSAATSQPLTPPSLYLRPTTSTPNLQLAFKGRSPRSGGPGASTKDLSPLKLGTPRDRTGALQHGVPEEGTSEEEEDSTVRSSSAESSAADTSGTGRTTPPTPSVEVASPVLNGTEEPGTTNVVLPPGALALSIPASPLSGRMQQLRYVKLPWTHDETDLAQPGGGFEVGSALIAETLCVGPFAPRAQDEGTSRERRPGKVLVHCQCGVSRSATLVIAFVMQAAALGYPLEGSAGLTGMHDCYTLVKE